MIEIKSFNGKTEEEVEFTGTIGSYLDGVGVEWRNIVVQPIQISVNGRDIFHHDWDNTLIGYEDKVEFVVIPEGGALNSISKIFSFGGDFFTAWLFKSASKGARSASRYEQSRGSNIEASEIKANTIKFGQTVPEIFGRHRRFFDYLNEPRSYYKDKRTQVTTSVLCVGNGYYDSEPFRIGDTPFSNTENTTGRMFQPNEYLEGYTENWHTVPEIGATSSGTAGLELSVDPAEESEFVNIDPDGGYTFSGLNGSIISRNDGSLFNDKWGQGIEINIGVEKIYQYRTQGNLKYCEIIGDFSDYETDADLQRILPIRQTIGYKNQIGTAIPKFMNRTDPSNAVVRYYGILMSYGGSGYVTLDEQGYGRMKFYNYDFPVNQDLPLISGSYHMVVTNNGNNIEVQTDIDLTKYNGQDVSISYVGGGGNVPKWTGVFRATPNGVKAKELELDFFFPQGLCWINDNGSIGQNSAPIEVEIRNSLDNSLVYSQRHVYADNTNDQIGHTKTIVLDEEIEPLVRVRRTERGSDSIQSHSQVVWKALKSRLPDIERYPDWTVVGVTMETGGKIAAQSENRINAIVTRKLSVMSEDGTWSDELQPTRDIPPVVRYIAEQIGYTVNDLDMAEILRLYNLYWKPRGEYFDYICDQTTVRNALEMCLSAGMSDLTISNGLLKPYRDEIMTEPEQAYSSQNAQGIDYHFVLADENQDFDGVEIEYTDPVTFDRKIIICSTKPEHKRIKLQKVSLNGVTDELRAWKIGMRLWKEMQLIRKQFTFKTEMDGFNSEYGSFITVTNDSASYQQSCLILQITGRKITLSEKVKGEFDVFSYRLPNGKPSKAYNIIKIEENEIWIDGDILMTINLNKELPQALLGIGSKHVTHCIVDDITPNGLENATIKASNYDERIFKYDDYTEVE